MIGVARRRRPRFGPKAPQPRDRGALSSGSCRARALVNRCSACGLDLDFGPFFLEFSSLLPYGAKLCFNGHHWAQRQAEAAGIAFTALDNGFLDCDDPDRLQRICDRLSAAKITRSSPLAGAAAAPLHRGRPPRRLPLRAVDPAGRVLPDPGARPTSLGPRVLRGADSREPRPRPARQGQPDLRPPRAPARQTPTPSRWRHRVITPGVTASIHVDYKHSEIKQYHKLERSEPKPRSTTPGTSPSANG